MRRVSSYLPDAMTLGPVRLPARISSHYIRTKGSLLRSWTPITPLAHDRVNSNSYDAAKSKMPFATRLESREHPPPNIESCSPSRPYQHTDRFRYRHLIQDHIVETHLREKAIV